MTGEERLVCIAIFLIMVFVVLLSTWILLRIRSSEEDTDKKETISLDTGRLEMPLGENTLLLTPYGKDCIFKWMEL